MATTPSTLVLRGSDGAVLRHEDGTLTLRRGDEEIRIPLEAVQDVLPDGRAISIELRAPEGTQHVVHRVEDVSEAAVGAFATTVGTALAELPEPDPSLDGATLVTTRSLAPAPTSRVSNRARWAKLVLVMGPSIAVFIAMAVILVVRGQLGPLVLALLMGVGGFILNLLSSYATEQSYLMWYLPRHGITVMAEFLYRIPSARVYEYTDQSGATHRYRTQRHVSRVEVSYDPREPARVVGVSPVTLRLLVAFTALLLWCATFGFFVLMVLVALNV
ncbi:hypothetical protein [Streptomyces sp. NPDC056352]|uniref:hypothetical protein n=1 Tax=unclassified Streptomyces TaxID=2593676 RepID=UPI0035DC18AC